MGEQEFLDNLVDKLWKRLEEVLEEHPEFGSIENADMKVWDDASYDSAYTYIDYIVEDASEEDLDLINAELDKVLADEYDSSVKFEYYGDQACGVALITEEDGTLWYPGKESIEESVKVKKRRLRESKSDRQIIWTNDPYEVEGASDLSEGDLEEIKSEMSEFQGYDYDDITEEDVDDYLYELNNSYLEDTVMNLDKDLPCNIVAVADIGRWDGRRTGFKFLGDNLSDIFKIGEDYNTYYVEDGELCGEFSHHDGTNYVIYRMFTSYDYFELEDGRIVTGEEWEEMATVDPEDGVTVDADYIEQYTYDDIPYLFKDNSWVEKFTVSLAPYVNKVYGW